MNYNRNASNFYKLKAIILMLHFFRIFCTSRQPGSINLPMKNRKTRNRFLVHLSKNMSNEKIICRDCPDSFISDVPPYVFCCTGQI